MSTVTTSLATYVDREDYAVKLQEMLDEPNKFKDICTVVYTDTRVIHNPYLTDVTVQTGYRGTAYTMLPTVQTDEYVTVEKYFIAPQRFDRADLAQCTYLKQMEIAERHAILLNEKVESAVYANYSNWTTFDNTQIGGSAGNITVTSSNIIDIVTGVRREITEANGDSLYNRNGGFFVWRPADFELLVQFAMANGFVTSDDAIRNGAKQGWNYAGFTHFSSNLLTAGHVMAGVKKAPYVYILKSTYGQTMIDDKDPGLVSGISIVDRIDYEVKAWANYVPVLYNITVA